MLTFIHYKGLVNGLGQVEKPRYYRFTEVCAEFGGAIPLRSPNRRDVAPTDWIDVS